MRESQKGIKMPKNGLVEGAGTTAKIDESFKDETNEKLSKLENDYFNFKGMGIDTLDQSLWYFWWFYHSKATSG